MVYVKDILAKKGCAVATVSPEVTALEAASKMNEHHYGALVVVEGESVVGIISERDILTRLVAVRKDPTSTPVKDIMTTTVACGKMDTPIEECQALMTNKRVRHIPIIEKKKLVGIITQGDITAIEIHDKIDTIEFLNVYIKS
jgi:CBS domain-containing protein